MSNPVIHHPPIHPLSSPVKITHRRQLSQTYDSLEKARAAEAGRRKATELTNRGFPTTFLGTCPVRRDALSDDGFGNKTVIPGDIRWAYLISA